MNLPFFFHDLSKNTEIDFRHSSKQLDYESEMILENE